jgi:hypothetical protein
VTARVRSLLLLLLLLLLLPHAFQVLWDFFFLIMDPLNIW